MREEVHKNRIFGAVSMKCDPIWRLRKISIKSFTFWTRNSIFLKKSAKLSYKNSNRLIPSIQMISLIPYAEDDVSCFSVIFLCGLLSPFIRKLIPKIHSQQQRYYYFSSSRFYVCITLLWLRCYDDGIDSNEIRSFRFTRAKRLKVTIMASGAAMWACTGVRECEFLFSHKRKECKLSIFPRYLNDVYRWCGKSPSSSPLSNSCAYRIIGISLLIGFIIPKWRQYCILFLDPVCECQRYAMKCELVERYSFGCCCCCSRLVYTLQPTDDAKNHNFWRNASIRWLLAVSSHFISKAYSQAHIIRLKWSQFTRGVVFVGNKFRPSSIAFLRYSLGIQHLNGYCRALTPSNKFSQCKWIYCHIKMQIISLQRINWQRES